MAGEEMSLAKQIIVQIYEIQTPQEAEGAIEDGVDHIGSVILSAAQWRDPILRETVRLVQSAGKVSSLIPLFSELALIRRLLDYYQPDLIHFCETLPLRASDDLACNGLLETQKAIRDEYAGVKIMRSLPIGNPGRSESVPTLRLAAHFESLSDYFLTDTLLLPTATATPAAQPVVGFVGITGQTSDWQVARALVLQTPVPVILAGGLSPENVAAAIARVKPFGVDSCTATNQVDADGRPIRFRKDRMRVRRFVQAAQGAFGNR
jgi:phosphoribosylanthranilate isomerase